MDPLVVSAIITAVGVVVVAGINGFVLFVLRDLRHQTNHMKDELVAEVRAAAFASGQKSEKDNPT